jgi:hypothetical protein
MPPAASIRAASWFPNTTLQLSAQLDLKRRVTYSAKLDLLSPADLTAHIHHDGPQQPIVQTNQKPRDTPWNNTQIHDHNGTKTRYQRGTREAGSTAAFKLPQAQT